MATKVLVTTFFIISRLLSGLRLSRPTDAGVRQSGQSSTVVPETSSTRQSAQPPSPSSSTEAATAPAPALALLLTGAAGEGGQHALAEALVHETVDDGVDTG